MAQRSPVVPVTDDPSRVVAWPQAEEGASGSNKTQAQEGKAGVGEKTKQAVQAGVDSGVRSLQNTQRKLADSADQLKTRILRFADKRPFYFLGIIAGTAFVTGVALRIWRSNSYE